MYLCQRKIFAKSFSGWGTDRNIIEISCHSRLFIVLHLLVKKLIMMAIARKAAECFHFNTIFLLLEKTRVIVQPWCIKEDWHMGAFEWIIWLLYYLELSENHRVSDGFRGRVELNWFPWTRLILYAKCGNGFSNFTVCLFILSLFVT